VIADSGLPQAALSKHRLFMIALPAALAALLINVAVRIVAVVWWNIPEGALSLMGLFVGSIMPALGPAFGCYMIFRHPKPTSMRRFLAMVGVLVFIGPIINLVLYLAVHHNLPALGVGVTQGLIATVLAVPRLALMAHEESLRTGLPAPHLPGGRGL